MGWFYGPVYTDAGQDDDATDRADPGGDHESCLVAGIAVYLIPRSLGDELIKNCGVDQERRAALFSEPDHPSRECTSYIRAFRC